MIRYNCQLHETRSCVLYAISVSVVNFFLSLPFPPGALNYSVCSPHVAQLVQGPNFANMDAGNSPRYVYWQLPQDMRMLPETATVPSSEDEFCRACGIGVATSIQPQAVEHDGKTRR